MNYDFYFQNVLGTYRNTRPMNLLVGTAEIVFHGQKFVMTLMIVAMEVTRQIVVSLSYSPLLINDSSVFIAIFNIYNSR